MIFLLQINIGADVEAMSELLFTESFSRLASLQQNVLLAISLFEGGASLTALYQVSGLVDLFMTYSNSGKFYRNSSFFLQNQKMSAMKYDKS